MKSMSLILGSLLIIFTFISCSKKSNNKNGSKNNMQTSATSKTMQNSTSMAQTTKIKVRQKKPYGKYLTDKNGKSLYLFLKDTSGESNCYGQCAQVWPPLLTESKNVKAGQQVNKSMLGVIKRHNGSYQVTYNGHPLYYYKMDEKPGDVKGQDKKGFGAEWYLVKPNGHKMGDVEESGE